ncbi:MAG: PAS domain S-box protein [Bacteroidales bacterium]|nr:PAS domain S-box protein [Bacteroidales bacterium]
MNSISPTILIVDEISNNHTELQDLFCKQFPNTTILNAQFGKIALDLANSENPDIIILTPNTKDLDGFELCRILKYDSKTNRIPIIFLSESITNSESRIKAIESGSDALLAKPINKSELYAQVRAMLKIREANIYRQTENERLQELVNEQMAQLKTTHTATLNLLEDLTKEVQRRSETETALRESEKFLLETQAIAKLGTFTFDIQTGIWSSSEILDKIFGIDTSFNKSFEGWVSIIHPNWQQTMNDYFINEVLGKRQKFDKKYKIIRQNDRSDRWLHGVAELKYNDQNQPISLIGTIRDISELEDAQLEVTQSREEFKELFDKAPIGYHEIDTEGRFVRINEAELEMFGYSYEEMIGKPFWEFVVDSEASQDAISRKITNGLISDSSYERTICRKDGTHKFVLVQDRLLKDSEGKIKGIQSTLQDITERKKQEDILKVSEMQLKAAQHLAKIGNWELDLQTNRLLWSDEIFDIFELDPSSFEPTYNAFIENIHPDDRNKVNKAYTKSITDKTSYSIDHRLLMKDGSIKYVHEQCESEFDENGNPIISRGTVQDITERKQIETALYESERKFREMADLLPQIVFETDTEGKLTYVNKQAYKIFGYDESENMIGISTLNFYTDEDKERAIENIKNRVAGEYQGNNEYDIIRKNGSSFPGLVYSSPIKLEGETVGLRGIIIDITSQKNAQKALMESEQKFRNILRNSPFQIWSFNGEVYDYVNKSYKDFTGIKVASKMTPSLWTDYVHPDDLESSGAIWAKAWETKSEHDNYFRLRRHDGVYRDFWCHASPVFDTNGHFVHFQGFNIDITEQKKAQDLLHENEEQLKIAYHYARGLIEASLDPLVTISLEGKITDVNAATEKATGLSREKLINTDFSDYFTNKKRAQEGYLEAFEKGQIIDYQLTLKHISGKETEVVYNASLYNDYQGNTIGVFAAARDISNQKRIEKQYSQLFNQMQDGFALHEIICDENNNPIDYRFLALNPSFEEQTGTIAKDVVGKTLLEVFPQSEQYWIDIYGEVALTGIPTSFENYHAELGKYFQVTAFSPTPGQFATLFTDITTRKEAEAIINNQQAKLEELVKVRTDELMIRETYLSAIIDNHPGMFWMKDTEGRFIFSNRANSNFLRIVHGEKAETLIGKTDADFCTPYETKAYKKEDQTVIKTKCEVRGEDKITIGTKDLWFEKLKFPVVDPNNQIIGVAGYSIDITERIKRDAQLRMQSEAFESFALSIVITNNEGIIEWANPAFEKLTGFLRTEVIGKKANMLNSGKMNTEFYTQLWQTILSGQIWTGEFINRRKDGTIYYEESTITPVRDKDGIISHFIAIKINISHRKEMEEALRRSEERWQFALEGSGDGVYDYDLKEEKMFYSPQWKSMLGYSAEEIGDSPNEWTNRMHLDELEKNLVNANQLINGREKSNSTEHRLLCKDGTYKWVLSRASVISKDESGKVTRIIGILSDITEIKMLEESLRRNIEKERELNEIKSRFVSTASHEFRTPLASILITNESLLHYWERMEKAQITAKLEKINSTIHFLTNIVNDVLQLSKIQEGKIEFNPERIDFSSLCREIIDSFKEDQFNNEIIFESDLKEIFLNVDKRLMRQTINNLMSNALKYSPNATPINVSLKIVNDEILLSVQDHGIGIPLEDQRHLFTPFFRASNSKMIQGNGLGLNIIRESARIHGGDIKFMSNPSEGSTFILNLPIK